MTAETHSQLANFIWSICNLLRGPYTFTRDGFARDRDAWIDESKTKVGYEIPLNRHFYRYEPPRPLEEIRKEIKTIEKDILALLSEVAGSNGDSP